jgi:uncharacterized membrane protein YccC
MIKHYLKVAFRNMWKYKGQTLISVMRLAVGFACFAMATEMSAWIYVSILLALFMAIVVCVGGRVYKTSRENPINSINR